MDALELLAMNMQELINGFTEQDSDNELAIGIIDCSEGAKDTVPMFMTHHVDFEKNVGLISAVNRSLIGQGKDRGYHVEQYRLEYDGSEALFAVATKKKPQANFLKIFNDIVLDEALVEGTFIKITEG